ncbi:MAG: hypothetical protein WC587_01970 [Candidatus Paceibacterota bacterium]
MQDKPKIVLTGAVIIAVLAGGYFYSKSKQQTAPSGETQQNQEQLSDEIATTTEIAGQQTSGMKAPAKVPNWKTYTSGKYKVELQYPNSWAMKEGYISSILSGDLVISAIRGWTSDVPEKFKIYTIDEMTSAEIIARNFGSFGKSSTVVRTTVAGQPARLITSSKDGLVRGGLLVSYPKPVSFDGEIHYYFMVYFFHSDSINTIKNTVKFYGM